MKKEWFLLAALLFSSIAISGQGLKIQAVDRTEIFPASAIYEARLATDAPAGLDACCINYQLTGQLLSASKDSIYFAVNSMTYRINNEKGNKAAPSYLVFTPPSKFATADLIELVPHTSDKKRRRRKFWGITGGILMLSGVITAINGLYADTKISRNRMLISGGAQFGLGTVLAITSTGKSYRFARGGGNWRVVE